VSGDPSAHPALALDETVHQRVRLGILAILSEAAECTFPMVRDELDLTDGNLSRHLRVLEDAGLVSRSREAQRRPVHLEAEVFDLMTKWIERYQGRAEERFSRLDAVLAGLDEHGDPVPQHDQHDQHDQQHEYDAHDRHTKGQAS
jgi:DNA-binding transcriptional ArsR family regulator